jgi:adenine-specific DNA-methyltransferase
LKQRQKQLGQFFTPLSVARELVGWVDPKPSDRLLDPACGDGLFLSLHRRSVGVEVDMANAALARQRAPSALIHSGDFFSWASKTEERFEAAVGNPPFIRYQLFSGEVRDLAGRASSRLGAKFNGLSSSWAPFLVATAGLLKPGGRMAFVVPAEIGHATYAAPLLECLCRNFSQVGVVAIREKLFPDLSEDAWLLYCTGFGGRADAMGLNGVTHFVEGSGRPDFRRLISLAEWRAAGCRLRRFLLPEHALALYDKLACSPGVQRFSEIAHAGIGYVTGANDFFHLRPSEARLWEMPRRCLRVAVRRAEQLPRKDVDTAAVHGWLDADEPVLLLDLAGEGQLPEPARRYLDTADAKRAKEAYKCRNREPWYVVPDVRVPDGFLSYMSGLRPALVSNSARCVCTNSVHAVRLKGEAPVQQLQRAWDHPLAQLSCEIEGHPLGGGMLKLEPGEVAKTLLPMRKLGLSTSEEDALQEATTQMRRWRHYA